MKNKKNNPDRLEMNKYCRFCKKHTLHKDCLLYTSKDAYIFYAQAVSAAGGKADYYPYAGENADVRPF